MTMSHTPAGYLRTRRSASGLALFALGALSLSACTEPTPTTTSSGLTSTSPAHANTVPAPAAAPAPQTRTASTSGQSTQEYTGYEQKDVPADFTLPVLANGKGTMSLSSLVGPNKTDGLDGVIVAFTASWCGNCKASYPTLEALQKQYQGKLQILLLTQETEAADKQKMVEVIKKEGVTLPLLDAPADLVYQWLGERQNIPRFYLLDSTGMMRVKDTGFGQKMAKTLPNQVAWLMGLKNKPVVSPASPTAPKQAGG